ncbi:MAG: eamA-like transporter family protein [Rhizobium sp.]|nr:eamA-like transporter family protein [Rhizobium sp.]
MALHNNFKGALLMTLAMAGFTVNDAMVKLVAPDMNTGQIMFIRGLLTSILVFTLAWRMGAMRPLKTLLDPYLLLRTIGDLLSSVAYVSALGLLPLPNAAAILQALPLAVTMGAALFLGEHVGWRRWIAICIGFAGVLIIIGPDAEGFTFGGLLVVSSVITAAMRDLATKKINPQTPTLFISAVTSMVITIFGAVLIVPFGGWRPVPLPDLAALTLGASALFVGYQTLISAMRTGEISFIAPFRYTSLLWAVLLAALILAEYPDVWMLLGSAIVIAAGLFTFYRESKRHRAPVAASATATSS